MCQLSRNSGTLASRNPKGLSRPVAGKLYLYVSADSWKITCYIEQLWNETKNVNYKIYTYIPLVYVVDAYFRGSVDKVTSRQEQDERQT
jgi:hypothetical protein